jgi:hypothetical protein
MDGVVLASETFSVQCGDEIVMKDAARHVAKHERRDWHLCLRSCSVPKATLGNKLRPRSLWCHNLLRGRANDNIFFLKNNWGRVFIDHVSPDPRHPNLGTTTLLAKNWAAFRIGGAAALLAKQWTTFLPGII